MQCCKEVFKSAVLQGKFLFENESVFCWVNFILIQRVSKNLCDFTGTLFFGSIMIELQREFKIYRLQKAYYAHCSVCAATEG